MSTGCFTDKTQPPSTGEIQLALGPTFPLWEKLVQFIQDRYQWSEPLSYGGKNYGWNLWVRKGGKALVSLFPAENRINAQVVLGKKQVEKALLLPLGEKTARMVRETPQYHDGKWLLIPVETERDEQDVEQLILLKKRPGRKP